VCVWCFCGVCMCLGVCVWVGGCVCVWCFCVGVCVCVCMCGCVCVYSVHTYIHAYIHTYTNKHAYIHTLFIHSPIYDLGIIIWFPAWEKDFSLLSSIQADPKFRPPSYAVGTGGKATATSS